MTRLATDADYNSKSRKILMKIDVYFNGPTQAPTVMSVSDYLIEAEILEESGAESNWPLGSVSSNELTFSLHNKDAMFSPTNESGPYFGKIKKES